MGAPIGVAQYLELVLSGLPTPTVREVALADALGCVLADEAAAALHSPGFDNAAMDGYALRSADAASAAPTAPVRLAVVADLPAGGAPARRIGPGEAARIMTGAPIPDGADAVVPVERTDGGTATVAVLEPAAPGAHIRRRGSDAAVGDRLLAAGQVATARALGAAAAGGLDRLRVIAPPRVGVIATGSELAPLGTALEPGQVPDANSTLIAAAIAESGSIPVPLGRCADDPAALRARVDAAAADVDAIVLTGGVGPGAYDVVRLAFEPTGTMRFVAVRLQPGRPQAFGRAAAGTPLFGLPGNPVAAYISFAAFVEPALRVLRGLDPEPAPPVAAVAGAAWSKRRGREQHVPVRLADGADGRVLAVPAGAGGHTHQLSALAAADGLAIVAEDVESVRVGDALVVRRLPGRAR